MQYDYLLKMFIQGPIRYEVRNNIGISKTFEFRRKLVDTVYIQKCGLITVYD